MDLVTTAPSVSYKVFTTSGEVLLIDNPTKLPPATSIDHMEEPIVSAEVYCPPEYVGDVMGLCRGKEGRFQGYDLS